MVFRAFLASRGSLNDSIIVVTVNKLAVNRTKSSLTVNLFDKMNENNKSTAQMLIFWLGSPTDKEAAVCTNVGHSRSRTKDTNKHLSRRRNVHMRMQAHVGRANNCHWEHYATHHWPSELHLAPARGQRSRWVNQPAQTGWQGSKRS